MRQAHGALSLGGPIAPTALCGASLIVGGYITIVPGTPHGIGHRRLLGVRIKLKRFSHGPTSGG